MQKKNPIVGDQYAALLDAMIMFANKQQLPQLMEINDISSVSLVDLRDFMTKFISDTCLDIRFSAEVCPSCNRLHAFLIVDYPDEETNKSEFLM